MAYILLDKIEKNYRESRICLRLADQRLWVLAMDIFCSAPSVVRAAELEPTLRLSTN